MTRGVYAIVHIASGRRYVGSSVRVEDRIAEHRRKLRKGIHHAKRLQAAWNKYGPSAFNFETIEVVVDGDREHLFAREQHHIDATVRLFNGSRIARVPEPRRGVPLSAETKRKLSAALKNRTFTEAWRKKISRKAAGRRMTPAERAAMSVAKKGRKIPTLARRPTDEQRERFRQNVAAIFSDPQRKAAWVESNRRSHIGRPWSAARRAAYERMKADPSVKWTHRARPESGL